MLIMGRAMVDTSFTSPLRTRWPRPPIVLDQPAPHRSCRPQRAQLELQTLVPPRTARAQPRRQLPIRRPVPRPAGWIPLLISHMHRPCSATRSASTSSATPASLSSSAGRHWATRPRPIRPSARGAPVRGRARRSPDWATRSEPHRPEDPECGRVRSCPRCAGPSWGQFLRSGRRQGKPPRQQLGSRLIGPSDPRGVHPQCRHAAAAVPESTGDGAQVDPDARSSVAL